MMDTLRTALLKLLDPANLLGATILVAWLTLIFMRANITDNQTLNSVVMIVVGYLFGSSSGSKDKDKALVSQATSTLKEPTK